MPGTRFRIDRSVYGKEFRKILLSHHPDCYQFRNDTISVGGDNRLCIGCLFMYPAMLLALLFLWICGIDEFISPSLLFFIGVAMASLQIISLAGLARARMSRAVVKMIVGVGIGSGLYAILSIPAEPVLKWILIILCLAIVGIQYYMRIERMKKICARCRWKGEWTRCRGYREE